MANEIHVAPTTTQEPLPPTPPPATAAPGAEPSLGELFKQLAQDSSVLIKQEIALAKVELGESASRAASSAAKLAIAAGLAMVAGLVLTAFLVLLLGELIDNYWLAALLVGAVYAVIGGVMAAGAVKRLKEISFAPETTIQTLKQDKVWAQSEAQQVKRDLTA